MPLPYAARAGVGLFAGAVFLVAGLPAVRLRTVTVSASDARFAAGAIKQPRSGYIDSPFINSDATRLYFTYSIFQPNDLFKGTRSYSLAPALPDQQTMPGLEWNADLYMTEWNGSEWTVPVSLGANINTVGNECCVWVNAAETEMIFYRDTFGLPGLGASGNFRATRASRNGPWGVATALPGEYGVVGQSSSTYRHDIHKTASGELYLSSHDPQSPTAGQLLFGKPDGRGGWLPPVPISITDSSADETQPWLSHDELQLLFNRRNPTTGETSLWVSTRVAVGAPWMSPFPVSVKGFADAAGRSVWGEPTIPGSADCMLFVRFDTSQDPWKAQIMFSRGTAFAGFTNPVALTP